MERKEVLFSHSEHEVCQVQTDMHIIAHSIFLYIALHKYILRLELMFTYFLECLEKVVTFMVDD